MMSVYIAYLDSSLGLNSAVTGASSIAFDDPLITTFVGCVPKERRLCTQYCPYTCAYMSYLLLCITMALKSSACRLKKHAFDITGKIDRNLNVDNLGFQNF